MLLIKGNQPWIFIGRTDAEAETPILWSPDAQNWLIGKDPDAGKDWRQEEKSVVEDGIVRWHHELNGHESERTLGDSEGQGSLACCSPWGRKETQLNDWTITKENATASPEEIHQLTQVHLALGDCRLLWDDLNPAVAITGEWLTVIPQTLRWLSTSSSSQMQLKASSYLLSRKVLKHSFVFFCFFS